MSETPDYSAETTSVTGPVVTPTEPEVIDRVVIESKPNRLYQAAAWVAIVAGILFIVGTVFFSGFFLGKHSGGHGRFGPDGPDGPGMMMERDGRDGGPGMHRMGPSGPGWPGPSGEGQGPGSQGPGGPSAPGQVPPSVTQPR